MALAPLAATLATALPECPWQTWAGLPCPACGSGRAALALAELRPFQALVWNPLAAVGWALLVLGGPALGLALLLRRPVPALPRELPLGLRVGVVAVVGVNWLYLLLAGR